MTDSESALSRSLANAQELKKAFQIPPKRTFVVRKYHPDYTTKDGKYIPAGIEEVTVEAHLIILEESGSGMVQFIDLERGGEEGPVMHVRRVMFNCEDVEEKVFQRTNIITH